MSARVLSAVACVLVALVLGCNRAGAGRDDSGREAPSDAAPASLAPVGVGPRVVFLGDSLTAGLGVTPDEAFPAVLGRLLAAEGHPIRVVNAGVSGDTTAGGLARTEWALQKGADVLVICLGGNDGLRGQPASNIAANLKRIIAAGQQAGARVLLVGVQLPPNYGPDYTTAFAEIYPEVAEQTGVALVPNLLDGVGGDPNLNQSDGIHPNREGHRRAAENVLPQLRELLPGH